MRRTCKQNGDGEVFSSAERDLHARIERRGDRLVRMLADL